jgi:uncharacterized membrane protein
MGYAMRIKEDMSKNCKNKETTNVAGGHGSFLSKTNLFEHRYLILLFITIFGMFLRFYGLGTESIWLDEGTSINIAKRSLYSIIFENKDFAHPPLYYSILHFVMMYSDTEFFLRLPSAIFGILSIPVIYLVGMSLFDKREGLVAAALLSISLMHINYSQEGRSYALMMLLVLLTVYFFISACNSNNKIYWIFSVISGVVLVYTHFFGFFVIGALGIFYLLDSFDFKASRFKPQGTNKLFIISVASFILLSLPMILWVLGELGYASGNKTWGMAQEGFYYNIFINFSSYSGTLLIIYIILMLAGLFFCLRDSKRWFSLISLWLFLPLFTGYFLAGSMPFQPRYLLFVLPAFLLLISKGIISIADIFAVSSNSNSFPKDKRKKTVSCSDDAIKSKNSNSTLVIVLIMLIVVALSYAPLHSYYSTYQKNDWRGASVYLASVTQSGDSIVPLPGYMGQPLYYYYDNSSDGTFREGVGYSEGELTSYVKGKQRIWFLVTWDISAANPNGSAVSWLQKNAFFVRQISNIYIFTYPAP